MTSTRPRMLLMNWVTLSPKQRYQLSAMTRSGYQVTILTLDLLGETASVLRDVPGETCFIEMSRHPAKRLLQFIDLSRKSPRGSVAIVPAASKVSFAAVLICRIFRMKTICVEWGDIGDWPNLPRSLRLSMWFSYRFSDVLWYKEPFMEAMLPESVRGKMFFLPNAVEAPNRTEPFESRQFDFIWANRFLERRRFPVWYAQAAVELAEERSTSSILMGLQPADQITHSESQEQEEVRRMASERFLVMGFSDPLPYFVKTRFFVHIANEVFGNNSLLEAMARGTVPIVNTSVGLNRLIEDGSNGFVFEKTPKGVADAMRRALDLTPQQWLSMSELARLTVQQRHAVEVWEERFCEMLALATGSAE